MSATSDTENLVLRDHNNPQTGANREKRDELFEIGVEMGLEAQSGLDESRIDVCVEGNVNPSLRVNFDARSASFLDVRRIAARHDMEVCDVWQLDRDLKENRSGNDGRETVIRARFRFRDDE